MSATTTKGHCFASLLENCSHVEFCVVQVISVRRSGIALDSQSGGPGFNSQSQHWYQKYWLRHLLQAYPNGPGIMGCR